MYPQILWGLLALSIPIIVHLFNFRKFRKVEFSNVSFLKEVQQETKSKSKIKHFLILLAFAQPYIPLNDSDNVAGKKSISVYIDNSFSMDGEGEEGRLIEVSKNKARELISNYGATDQFQLLTNDFEGRHQRFVSQEDALQLIDEVALSPQSRQLEEVISRQREMMNNEEGEKISFVLSDLQKATHQIDRIVKDSLMEVRFLPQASLYPNNIYIDSAWFETPVRALNQPEALHIRIQHSSQEIIENIPLSLVINGNRKSLGSFSIQPGVPTDTVLTFTQTEPGIKSGYLKIDDYPITFDDVFYLSYEVAESIRILHIEGTDNGSYVNKVFSNDPYYTLTSSKAANVNYGDFSNHDLIIVDQVDELSSGLILELEKFTSNGGTTFCIPSKNGNSRSYAELSLSMGGSIV
ncbi:MAG: BatA domain-containing protein, partial [Flavobacteriales bacterium]